MQAYQSGADKKPTVLLTRAFIPSAIEKISEDYEVIVVSPDPKRSCTDEEMNAAIKEYEPVGLIIEHTHPDMDLCKEVGVKCIANATVGFDENDAKKAAELGIPFTNAAGTLHKAAAKVGMYHIDSLAMRASHSSEVMLAGTVGYDEQFLRHPVEGAKLGVVGMGSIGSEVAKLAARSGMEIHYHNRNRKPEAEEKFVILDKNDEVKTVKAKYHSDLKSMAFECGYLAFVTPETEATKGMVNKELISNMQDGVNVVNLGRGSAVVDEDMVEALKSGKIAGFGTDVLNGENTGDVHSGYAELLKQTSIDRGDKSPVISLTSHIGSADPSTREAMVLCAAANISEAMEGKVPFNQVPQQNAPIIDNQKER
jgi:glyoxylate reductase